MRELVFERARNFVAQRIVIGAFKLVRALIDVNHIRHSHIVAKRPLGQRHAVVKAEQRLRVGFAGQIELIGFGQCFDLDLQVFHPVANGLGQGVKGRPHQLFKCVRCHQAQLNAKMPGCEHCRSSLLF